MDFFESIFIIFGAQMKFIINFGEKIESAKPAPLDGATKLIFHKAASKLRAPNRRYYKL